MATTSSPQINASHDAANNISPVTSHPSTMPHQPTSPPAAQEKATHSYYGPQPPQQPQPQHPNHFAQYPQSYGQPFQGYAPPPPPANFNPVPQAPPRPEEAKKWRNALIGLHATSFTLALTDIALSLSLLKWGFYSDAFYGDLAAIAIYVIVAPVMALVWSAADLITRWIRTAHRGITPGAHVGFTLIVWLACIVTGSMMAVFAAWLVEYDDGDYYRGQRNCYNSETGFYETCDDDDKDDDKDINTRRGIFVAITIFKFLLCVVNFVIFVRACIDTQRRNRASRPVIYVPYWAGPAAQGWQPLQQQPGIPMAQQPQGQNIPMQTRSPAGNEATSPTAEVTSPAPAHQVQEYYTPGNQGTAH